ncbi:hypothetical protein MRX96_010651 [Rhipicephalus microplus]
MKTPLTRSTNCRPAAAGLERRGERPATSAIYTAGSLVAHTQNADTCAATEHCMAHRKPAAELVLLHGDTCL